MHIIIILWCLNTWNYRYWDANIIRSSFITYFVFELYVMYCFLTFYLKPSGLIYCLAVWRSGNELAYSRLWINVVIIRRAWLVLGMGWVTVREFQSRSHPISSQMLKRIISIVTDLAVYAKILLFFTPVKLLVVDTGAFSAAVVCSKVGVCLRSLFLHYGHCHLSAGCLKYFSLINRVRTLHFHCFFW